MWVQASGPPDLTQTEREAALLLLREAQARLWRNGLPWALKLKRPITLPLLPEFVRLDYTSTSSVFPIQRRITPIPYRCFAPNRNGASPVLLAVGGVLRYPSLNSVYGGYFCFEIDSVYPVLELTCPIILFPSGHRLT